MPGFNGYGPVWGGGPAAGFRRGGCRMGHAQMLNTNRGQGRRFGLESNGKQNELKMIEDEEKLLQDELTELREYKKELQKK